jgi:hypothetical protein
MKQHSWIAIWAISAAIGLVACGPSAGDACSPWEDEEMECDGDEALVCMCDEPGGGASCPLNEGHWEADPYCSCEGRAILCE